MGGGATSLINLGYVRGLNERTNLLGSNEVGESV